MTELKGLGASTGQASGRIVRIDSFSDESVKAFPRDAILAVTMTTPEMIRVMDKASGVITRLGGRTCHAAVVCRGMGKPCIVGLGDAFDQVSDGLWATMISETGTINLLSPDESAERIRAETAPDNSRQGSLRRAALRSGD